MATYGEDLSGDLQRICVPGFLSLLFHDLDSPRLRLVSGFFMEEANPTTLSQAER